MDCHVLSTSIPLGSRRIEFYYSVKKVSLQEGLLRHRTLGARRPKGIQGTSRYLCHNHSQNRLNSLLHPNNLVSDNEAQKLTSSPYQQLFSSSSPTAQNGLERRGFFFLLPPAGRQWYQMPADPSHCPLSAIATCLGPPQRTSNPMQPGKHHGKPSPMLPWRCREPSGTPPPGSLKTAPGGIGQRLLRKGVGANCGLLRHLVGPGRPLAASMNTNILTRIVGLA